MRGAHVEAREQVEVVVLSFHHATWVPESKLTSSGLAASTSTQWAKSPGPDFLKSPPARHSGAQN